MSSNFLPGELVCETVEKMLSVTPGTQARILVVSAMKTVVFSNEPQCLTLRPFSQKGEAMK